MILLAIDTATESCSAALWVDGKLFYRSTIQPRLHAELILSFIDEILIEANTKKGQIQGIIVGQGPGAFTGVRIGVGVVQGLALALDIPVVAVSNLKTLAYRAYLNLNQPSEKTILVATDARMKEVYWAKYQIEKHCVKALTDEFVTDAGAVDFKGVDAYIGSGFAVYSELIEYATNNPVDYDFNCFSHAKDMLLLLKDDFFDLAQAVDVIEPVYLREP